MAEAIRCPSCATRYGLRPERVRPSHRRARCFTCGEVFAVEEAVARALAGPPAPSPEFLGAPLADTLADAPLDLPESKAPWQSAISEAPQPPEPSPDQVPDPFFGAPLRITQEELLEALAAVPASAIEAPAPVPAQPAPSALDPTEPGAELLRLKVGQEIFPGLTMAQLVAWVEEGRVLEQHLVARQLSEHWIEAYKVPGLRPTFDRLRRARQADTRDLDPAAEGSPSRKGFLGGLFGRR